MGNKKTIEQINERIKNGEAVVMTAEEIIPLVERIGVEAATQQVDVVTTGTFGAMCSTGVFLNFGHSDPPIKMRKITLNGVGAYGGIAAVDAYLGATEQSEDNPAYGGAHVIEDLLNGKKIHLEAFAGGTDCYPRKEVRAEVALSDLNEALLFNPRNAYQNYGAATNSTDQVIHTYMGTLLPNMGNVTYATAGELSPLLNDPTFRTIGIGTRVFLGGGIGYVAGHGTQHNTHKPCNAYGIPIGGAGTLALSGDLKHMSSEYLRAATYHNYGTSMFVGVGIPIPLLSAQITQAVAVSNRDIHTKVFDYGVQRLNRPDFGIYSYAQLQSGSIHIGDKTVRTAPLSSLSMARRIAEELQKRIYDRTFMLTNPVAPLGNNPPLKNLCVNKDEED